MGMPAARIGDMHVCPMVTGVVPHVGGPVLPPCAVTVLTGSIPQARIGDMCTCVGPPDVIVVGAFTVLVSGSPAARMLDTTAHGGKIVIGLPTVLIGNNGGGGGGGGMGGVAPPVAPKAAEPRGSGKGGSTTVAVDDEAQTVTIRTQMEFTGPDATPEYAAAAKKQIEETWSGTMTRNGKPYKVKVIVDTKVNPSGPRTPGYDQIIVDRKQQRMNQTLYGAGPGHQTPAAANDAQRPRRIAHEYGHTLGLEDGYKDTPQGSVPKDPSKKNDIMSETWPSNGVLPHPHQDHYDEVLKNHGW
jgi:uncharacterized Zn-binding protein involved in type VI secretion